ncbi:MULTISPECIES: oxidoreductase [Myxococcus]|uniref:oxidoreductase n=1 Tax=Myxococcus TaxID=32 RepID=UPI0011439A3E|nr:MULTISPECIES: oxidoreductase [Myxococcus]NOK02884.1 oxidoreductase [Myxococcus xanthus]
MAFSSPGRAPLRVALLGFGIAGRYIHTPLIQGVDGLVLQVVASRQDEAVRSTLPHVTLCGSHEAGATHPDVDLVVIATANELHVPLAEAALRAGKHVVVDKPFTITLEEARALRALAESRGLLLSVFHNRRWDTDFLALRALLAEGTLGHVAHVESRFDRFRPEVRSQWREQIGPGAGVWFDLGPHLVDQALQLFGLPESVSGTRESLREGAFVDDWFQYTLVYPRRQVVLQASMLIAATMPRFAVHGSRGSWLMLGREPQVPRLVTGESPEGSAWGEALGRDGAPTVASAGDYRQYYAGIRDALLGGAPNPVTPIQAVAVQAVLEAGIRAQERGGSQGLGLTEAERVAFDAGAA